MRLEINIYTLNILYIKFKKPTRTYFIPWGTLLSVL